MAELTKATSTEDLIEDYNKGMNFYQLADKYNVSLDTAREVVETKFPDADGYVAVQPEEAVKVK